MNRWTTMLLAALTALMLMLPAIAPAEGGAMLLVELPEDAQMTENVEFDNGDYIQTYLLENGVSVQLLRYGEYSVSIEELIAGDWPVNCGVQMSEMTEISGCPARHAHVLQMMDSTGYPVKAQGADDVPAGGKLTEIDLVVVSVDGTTLIYQSIAPAGEGALAAKALLDTLKVHGTDSAEVG